MESDCRLSPSPGTRKVYGRVGVDPCAVGLIIGKCVGCHDRWLWAVTNDVHVRIGGAPGLVASPTRLGHYYHFVWYQENLELELTHPIQCKGSNGQADIIG